MTALRTTLDVASTPLRIAGAVESQALAQRWVPINLAASLVGVSEGNLRRECPRLQRQGLACKLRPEGGRNLVWHIHPTYHPRLSRSHVLAEGQPIDAVSAAANNPTRLLMEATQSKRDAAIRRARITQEFRAWRASSEPTPGASMRSRLDAFVASIAAKYGEPVPHKTQLYQWHAMAPAGDDFDALACALLDRRGGDRRSTSAGGDGSVNGATSAGAWAMFEALYLRLEKPPLLKCYKAVRAAIDTAPEGSEARGWSWPSRRRVAQLVDERIDPSRLCMLRDGEKVWAERFKRPIEQARDKWGPGERWDADHCTLDFWVRVKGRDGAWKAVRPILTAWLDWRSRLLCGWWLSESGNAETVQAALLHALIPGRGPAAEFGPPLIAWMDNGKDFASAAIGGLTKRERRALPDRVGGAVGFDAPQGLLQRLGIEPRFAVPYNHNGKARIERFFGWVHSNFCVEQPSYWGSERRPRDRDSANAVIQDVMGLPTLNQAREWFAVWAQASNTRSDHEIADLDELDAEEGRAERLSPLEFYSRYVARRRVVDRDALAALEHKWERPLSVGKSGVAVKIARTTAYYGADEPALHAFKGSDRKVFVTYDPADISRVRVWDESCRFLCVARMNETFGAEMSRDAWAEMGKARREHKALASRKVDAMALLGTTTDAAYRAQREIDLREGRRLPAAQAEQPSLSIVRTPLDGQWRDIERAETRLLAEPAAEEALSPENFDITDLAPEISADDGFTEDAPAFADAADDFEHEDDSIDDLIGDLA